MWACFYTNAGHWGSRNSEMKLFIRRTRRPKNVDYAHFFLILIYYLFGSFPIMFPTVSGFWLPFINDSLEWMSRPWILLQLFLGQLWLIPLASRVRLFAKFQGSQILAALTDEQNHAHWGSLPYPDTICCTVTIQKLSLPKNVDIRGILDTFYQCLLYTQTPASAI